MYQAEIITIGNELLIGRILDTNAHWLCQQLTLAGLRVQRVSCVPDEPGAIQQALDLALLSSELVITTGGLGPTKDDLTKQTLAEYFGLPLAWHEPTQQHLQALLARRGRVLNELTRRQALQPEGAEVLTNEVGTAPGIRFTTPQGAEVICLPGVPHEMQWLVQQHVLPKLGKYTAGEYLRHHTLRTVGVAESILAERLQTVEDHLPPQFFLAYNPSLNAVDLRLSLRCAAQERAQWDAQFEATVQQLRVLAAQDLYAEEQTPLAVAVGSLLQAKGWHLACAESCTGGALAARVVQHAGASAYFAGGVVAYENSLKERLLGVDPLVLAEEGAVSEAAVRKMAEGVRSLLRAEAGLATSGIAGPDGGTPEKPVGMVWVAYSDPRGTWAQRYHFEQDRQRNIERTVVSSLDFARRKLVLP